MKVADQKRKEETQQLRWAQEGMDLSGPGVTDTTDLTQAEGVYRVRAVRAGELTKSA